MEIVNLGQVDSAPRTVPAPQISGFALSAGQVGFNFPGEPGESYVVEKTASLTPPVAWQTVQSLIGTNGTMRAADGPTNQSVFYRLRSP